MFVRRIVISLVLLIMTAAPIVLLAAEGGTARFTFSSATLVAGTEVKAGKYDIQWKPDGEIAIKLVGKPTTIKVQGKIEELETKLQDNSLGTTRDADGKTVLKRIDFKGKKNIRVTFE